MNIRHIEPDDAEAFLTLCKRLDAETTLMMLEPGERTVDMEEQRSRLESLAENETIFVAEEARKLIGFLALRGYQHKHKRHCAYIVIGILQAYTGQGVGTALFDMRNVGQWSTASPA